MVDLFSVEMLPLWSGPSYNGVRFALMAIREAWADMTCFHRTSRLPSSSQQTPQAVRISDLYFIQQSSAFPC